MLISKAIYLYVFFLYNKIGYFIKEMDTFGFYLYMTNLYISHRSFYAPTYSFCALCSMPISRFELLPDLIPFAILWHDGWTLEKNINIDMTCNYPTTIWESIFRLNVQISGRQIYFSNFCLYIFQGQKQKL